MPVQDFLITFRADTQGAMTGVNALFARVKEVDASLNAAVSRLSAASGRANPLAGITAAAPASVSSLRGVVAGLSQVNAALTSGKKNAQQLAEQYLNLRDSLEFSKREGTSIARGEVNAAGRVS